MATGAATASVVWLTIAWAPRPASARRAHAWSAQMESLVEARTTVLGAWRRGPHLIARGNGAHFEASYDEAMARCGHGDAPVLLETALAGATHPKRRQALARR